MKKKTVVFGGLLLVIASAIIIWKITENHDFDSLNGTVLYAQSRDLDFYNNDDVNMKMFDLTNNDINMVRGTFLVNPTSYKNGKEVLFLPRQADNVPNDIMSINLENRDETIIYKSNEKINKISSPRCITGTDSISFINDGQLMIYDVNTKELLSTGLTLGYPYNFDWLDKTKLLYIDSKNLMVYDLNSNESEIYQEGVDGFGLSSNREFIAYLRLNYPNHSAEIIDVETGEQKCVIYELFILDSPVPSNDGKYLLCGVNTNKSDNFIGWGVVIINTETGRMKILEKNFYTEHLEWIE